MPATYPLRLRIDGFPADRVFTQLILDLQLARRVRAQLWARERLEGALVPEQFERAAWSYLMDYLTDHHIPDDL
jgi:hypothetical protein